MREDRDSLVERLHRQTAEYSAFKLENERLKVWMSWELGGQGQAASVGADEPGRLLQRPGHSLIRWECPGAGESGTVSVPPHTGCRAAGIFWECGDSHECLHMHLVSWDRVDFGPNHGSLGGPLGTSHILIWLFKCVLIGFVQLGNWAGV